MKYQYQFTLESGEKVVVHGDSFMQAATACFEQHGFFINCIGVAPLGNAL